MNRRSAKKKKMSDIAKLAGVSESTVSRALAGSPLISEQTRARIQAIACEQHYVVNKQAQNLRLQSSRTVSVVIPVEHSPNQHVSDPFFLELLGSIADALTEANFDLLLSRVSSKDWRSKVQSHSYVDGLIVVGQSGLHSDLNDFAGHSHLPLVVWGAVLPEQKYLCVGSDNTLGGRMATEHLLACGKRRVLFLGDASLPEVALRHQGYCTALQQAGISVDAGLTRHCSFTRDSGLEAMQAVVAGGLSFDAVFAASDVLASSAVKILTAARRRIPEDVAVVGYDDISVAAHMVPALSTISQNIYQGGQMLVQTLFQQIRGQSATSVVLEPQLIVRETSASAQRI